MFAVTGQGQRRRGADRSRGPRPGGRLLLRAAVEFRGELGLEQCRRCPGRRRSSPANGRSPCRASGGSTRVAPPLPIRSFSGTVRRIACIMMSRNTLSNSRAVRARSSRVCGERLSPSARSRACPPAACARSRTVSICPVSGPSMSPYMMTRSACSEPACLSASRMAMMSRGVAPISFSTADHVGDGAGVGHAQDAGVVFGRVGPHVRRDHGFAAGAEGVRLRDVIERADDDLQRAVGHGRLLQLHVLADDDRAGALVEHHARRGVAARPRADPWRRRTTPDRRRAPPESSLRPAARRAPAPRRRRTRG